MLDFAHCRDLPSNKGYSEHYEICNLLNLKPRKEIKLPSWLIVVEHDPVECIFIGFPCCRNTKPNIVNWNKILWPTFLAHWSFTHRTTHLCQVLSEIDDLSCITSSLVLLGFLVDILLRRSSLYNYVNWKLRNVQLSFLFIFLFSITLTIFILK